MLRFIAAGIGGGALGATLAAPSGPCAILIAVPLAGSASALIIATMRLR